jgi:hypothetical protein
MTPKDIVKAWVDAFNRADVDSLANLYADNAINHQVAENPVEGRDAIRAIRNPLRSALAFSRRRRQGRDLPQHAVKQPACEMALRQEEPVVAGGFDQPSAGFHQPLL